VCQGANELITLDSSHLAAVFSAERLKKVFNFAIVGFLFFIF
jgi:hypothetical protein